MARERRSDGERFKYGQCLNDDGGCSKCKSKEIQKIPLRKDFVCAECGSELRECPPPPPPPPIWKWVAIGVGVVAVLGTGGYLLLSKGGDTAPEPKTTHSLLISSITADGWSVTPENLKTVNKGDTIWFQANESTDASAGVTPTIVLEDSTAVLEPANVTIKQEAAENVVVKAGEKSKTYILAVKTVVPKVTPQPKAEGGDDHDSKVDTPVTLAPVSTTATLKCGVYEGPMSGRTPNGIGGEIKVTRSYSIDLKNVDHETIEISAGDKIIQTKFKDGVLLQGQLIRSNGERKWIDGISERL